jgi:cytoskeletal protein RodZ
MNITRNNYETFFLLYADGELDPASMQEVENFVAVHPDLAEELEMLKDTVLAGENITMPGKELLLKPELWEEESISPGQEAMMMLLDNELEEGEAKKLVAEMAHDSSLQKDWNILQQTRLVAAAVEMPGKESLYRHEHEPKPLPIRSIGWVKWIAAAAVMAGLGWFGLNMMHSEKGNTPGLAINPPPVNKTQPVVNQPVKTPNDITDEKITKNDEASTTTTAENNQTPVETAQTKIVVQQQAKQVKEQQVPPVEYASSNQQNLVEMVPETSIPVNTVATTNPNEINKPILKTIQTTETTPVIAQPTVYNEDDVNDDTEYVNIAGAKIKKQKLRGVFRNVTRTIGRSFDKLNVAQVDVASVR